MAENKYFVALKLLNGKDVQAIQPVVLKFAGTEPCVPLRLTAIAAMKDLPVNLWVLGAGARTVPRTTSRSRLNDARIDWLNAGSNYAGGDMVKQAANEAGGNAFITEYAGASTVTRAQVYMNGQFNVATLRAAMTPPVYLSALTSMSGLANDTLMLPLLSEVHSDARCGEGHERQRGRCSTATSASTGPTSRSRPSTWRA